MGLRIFGYGSLIWNPSIPFSKQEVVCIKGWARRFYQGSQDHRGTVEKPGRVCTIIREESSECWGVVFTIDDKDEDYVVNKLDIRERNGYTVEHFKVYAKATDEAPLYSDVLCYVAGPDNEVYLGPAPLPKMAEHIVSSEGKSGKNACYVLNLAKAIREMMPHVQDDHLFELENEILSLLQ